MSAAEHWAWITGYENLYQVSNLGHVKRVWKHSERMCNLFFNQSKTLIVNLSKNHKIRRFTVGKLVANAFILNPNHYKTVIHLDNDPTNNQVSNLQWSKGHHTTTAKINKQAVKTQPKPKPISTRTKSKHKNGIVATFMNHEQQYFTSIPTAAKDLGLTTINIKAVLTGDKLTTFGYKFRYATPREKQEGKPLK